LNFCVIQFLIIIGLIASDCAWLCSAGESMSEVVLRFDVERARVRPSCLPEGGSAVVIIFPGVRVEALQSAPALSGRNQLMAGALSKLMES
jgi:hypothetical protein